MPAIEPREHVTEIATLDASEFFETFGKPFNPFNSLHESVVRRMWDHAARRAQLTRGEKRRYRACYMRALDHAIEGRIKSLVTA